MSELLHEIARGWGALSFGERLAIVSAALFFILDMLWKIATEDRISKVELKTIGRR